MRFNIIVNVIVIFTRTSFSVVLLFLLICCSCVFLIGFLAFLLCRWSVSLFQTFKLLLKCHLSCLIVVWLIKFLRIKVFIVLLFEVEFRIIIFIVFLVITFFIIWHFALIFSFTNATYTCILRLRFNLPFFIPAIVTLLVVVVVVLRRFLLLIYLIHFWWRWFLLIGKLLRD